MAKKEAAAAPDAGDVAATGKKKKLLLIIGGAVGVLVLGVVLGVLLLGGKDEDADEEEHADEPPPPALYVTLGEKFVASLPMVEGENRPHMLQLSISAMTRDPAVVEEIEFNAPLLRDRLNSLLARQEFEKLRTEEGKVALREEVLTTVRGILDNEIAASAAKGDDEDAEEEEEEEEKPAKKKKKKAAREDDAEEEVAPHGVEQIFFTEFVLQ